MSYDAPTKLRPFVCVRCGRTVTIADSSWSVELNGYVHYHGCPKEEKREENS